MDEGPVTFHERVTLTRASRGAVRSRNIAMVYELEGAVDVDALRAAVRHLVQRHEAFRTSFVPGGPTGFVRRVHDGVDPLREREFQDEPEAAAWMRAQMEEVRSLDEAPLAVAAIARFAEDRAYFGVSADHVIADKLSALLAWKELARAYADHVDGVAPDDEPAPQPRELVGPNLALVGPVLKDRSTLPPYPEDGYALEGDASRPGGLDPTPGVVLVALPGTGQLRRAANAAGVSRGALLVTALTYALREHARRPDVGFAVVRSGRTTRREWDTVAYMVFTDTYRCRAGEDADDDALLTDAERFLGDTAPWRRVYNALAAPPTRRILLNLLGPPVVFRLPGVETSERVDLLPPRELFDVHDLVVQMVEGRRACSAVVAYRDCRFERATMEAIAATFEATVRRLVARAEGGEG